MTSKAKATADGNDDERDTKSRIIAVAERMIAEHGVQRFSIRDISREAGVNLAAIHYHFGSKERLIAEVLARQVSLINAERLALLDKLESAAGDRPLSVEEILEIVFKPVLRIEADEKSRQYTRTAKSISRFCLEPGDQIVTMLKPHFMPFKERVVKMFARALPGLGREEIEWRTYAVFGMLNHYLLFTDVRCRETGKSLNVKKELRRLVAFSAAGMRAPSGAAPAH